MKPVWQAHLALFGANLIYGINYTVAKDIMPDYLAPSGFILLRVLGATALFWLVQRQIKGESIAKKDHLRLAICAFFGVATNQLLFFNGLNLTSPINAAIIMTSNPVLVLIMAAIIIKERITLQKSIGILLGAAGALFLILSSAQTVEAPAPGWGNLMVFLNAASYGVYLVLVKPLMQRYKPLTVIKWVFTYGLLFVLPFGWEQFMSSSWDFPPNIWWGLVFVVVGTTFLAYLFNIYALKTVNPSTVSFYIYLQPLLASLVAILLGKDQIQSHMIISALLIFTGVYLVSKPKKA